MVYFHADGGRHGGSYYGYKKNDKSVMKVVGSDYIDTGEKGVEIVKEGGIMIMSYYKNAVEDLEIIKEMVDSCSSRLCDITDEVEMEYCIWEKDGSFDDATHSLTEGRLRYLVDEHWLISEEVYGKLLLLGSKIRRLSYDKKDFNVITNIHKDSEWADIMGLADEIKYMMTRK